MCLVINQTQQVKRLPSDGASEDDVTSSSLWSSCSEEWWISEVFDAYYLIWKGCGKASSQLVPSLQPLQTWQSLMGSCWLAGFSISHGPRCLQVRVDGKCKVNSKASVSDTLLLFTLLFIDKFLFVNGSRGKQEGRLSKNQTSFMTFNLKYLRDNHECLPLWEKEAMQSTFLCKLVKTFTWRGMWLEIRMWIVDNA